MYKFSNGKETISVIAISESEARQKAEILESFALLECYTLNESEFDV
jgi:hypothetical protein